jgi:hypothetical protein
MKKANAGIAVVLAMTAIGPVVTTSVHAAPQPKVVFFGLYPEPEVKPARIFLTANAGPYVKDIRWTGWGTAKAIGKGTFISDCASCGEKESKPATLTFRRTVSCKQRGVRIYAYQRLQVKTAPGEKQRIRSLGNALVFC